MSTWLEIRCSTPKPNTGFGANERCLSSMNSGPMAMASDTRSHVLEALKSMEKEARETGWKKTREGWVCPHCSKES